MAVWTAIVDGPKRPPDHAVLHVIAAILSLLLLAGMFGTRPAPGDDAAGAADIEPAQPVALRDD